MDALKNYKPIKRSGGKYKVVMMNEDSHEEIARFSMNRWLMAAAICSIFVFGMLITTALFLFTPMKYFVPGNNLNETGQQREIKLLKMRTDSLENALVQQHKFSENILNVLRGNVHPQDTTTLSTNDHHDEQVKPKRK